MENFIFSIVRISSCQVSGICFFQLRLLKFDIKFNFDYLLTGFQMQFVLEHQVTMELVTRREKTKFFNRTYILT